MGRPRNNNPKQQNAAKPAPATTSPPVKTEITQIDDSAVAATASPDPAVTEPSPTDKEISRVLAEVEATGNVVIEAPSATRARQADLRSQLLSQAINNVAKRPDNPALASALGTPISQTEERPVERPEILNIIDKTMDPFLERMSPGIAINDKEAGELHYSLAMLIRQLLVKGGSEMKIGVPYLVAIFNRYSGSVFHPQSFHRGVGMMRGSEDDINFYRNVSRLWVDLSDPKAVSMVLARTDIAHFKKLTMNVSSPAAAEIAKNLATVISRFKAG